MNRRELLVALAAGLVAHAGGVAAQTDPLGDAFAELAPGARQRVQQELQVAGVYSGAIDGKYGRGTAAGLRQAAEFVAYNSRGKVQPKVGSAAGARDFVAALASGEMASWLYGEGEENDM